MNRKELTTPQIPAPQDGQIRQSSIETRSVGPLANMSLRWSHPATSYHSVHMLQSVYLLVHKAKQWQVSYLHTHTHRCGVSKPDSKIHVLRQHSCHSTHFRDKVTSTCMALPALCIATCTCTCSKLASHSYLLISRRGLSTQACLTLEHC